MSLILSEFFLILYADVVRIDVCWKLTYTTP